MSFKRLYNREPGSFYYHIDQIKEANESNGFHFFEKGAMRFFKSRILSEVYGGQYFITSEVPPQSSRKYTIRRAHLISGNIITVGKHCEYATAAQAKAAIKRILDASCQHEHGTCGGIYEDCGKEI